MIARAAHEEHAHTLTLGMVVTVHCTEPDLDSSVCTIFRVVLASVYTHTHTHILYSEMKCSTEG